MKTDIIKISNSGSGFQSAIEQTLKASQYRGLGHKEEMQLRLCTEEMLSLVRSVTGGLQADFWVESEEKSFSLHLSAKTVMDREKRENLIASATSRKNEAASSFLGKLRDTFESALVSEADNRIPDEALDDLANHVIEIPEWDEYEQSILRSVADDVKIGIRGGVVDMTVSKHFE